jgi:hypothetical protein
MHPLASSAGAAMSAEAWIALASVAVLVLNGLLFVAFVAGKVSNRVRALEAGALKTGEAVEALQGELSEHKAQTSALDATLGSLKETVRDGFPRLEDAISGRRVARGRAAD